MCSLIPIPFMLTVAVLHKVNISVQSGNANSLTTFIGHISDILFEGVAYPCNSIFLVFNHFSLSFSLAWGSNPSLRILSQLS